MSIVSETKVSVFKGCRGEGSGVLSGRPDRVIKSRFARLHHVASHRRPRTLAATSNVLWYLYVFNGCMLPRVPQ